MAAGVEKESHHFESDWEEERLTEYGKYKLEEVTETQDDSCDQPKVVHWEEHNG
jgi:hypothetical protein